VRVEALDQALDCGLFERARGDRINVLTAHVLGDFVEEFVLRACGYRLHGWGRCGRRTGWGASQQHEARADGGAGQHGKESSDSVGHRSRAEKGLRPRYYPTRLAMT
jgi:hypothetical protein